MPKTSARLLALLSLLQVRRDWPGAVLAERLEVSARTVRRDVDRLRELGYPIATTKGPDGGYRLEAGTDLPPLLFDDEQAIALTIGLGLATTSGVGIEDAAAQALNTLRQVMPARLRHRIDTLRIAAVDARPNHAESQVDTEVLTALGVAVHAREVLRFDYASATATAVAPLPRTVEPHHLVTRAGRWYLVAWDLDRTDWRTFRVDRITPRIPTGPRFTPRELPGGSVSAFLATRFRGSASGEWPCRGEVILDLPATRVLRHNYQDWIVEELGPNRCKLTLGSWSWVGLAAVIGNFDADIEVVGPAELAEAFARLARRYAAAGSGAGTVGYLPAVPTASLTSAPPVI
ncbi:YafY family transcriptional regulator [Nocardia cyriacigeorgica]|uniref:YafY family transcriptional regulator n=1 Tax=Nocardia cyriacigeorgica TaxID=135487 RepID=A0A6P1DD88_9NOCA|nr:YafY family protein [Nocardia cyriacigeorgica]NEW47571.1 YafY family transcriptional regulator [Nocardia cyriacigeorgica]NEW49534.1 YafY family transcriptional regulator [Nocardia cyriacigeorgica]